MGWGRMLLLGNIGQQLDIRDVNRELETLQARFRASGRFDQEVSDYLVKLSVENSELKLYLASIARLLVAKNVISPAELAEIVESLDRSDGKIDKRFTGEVAPP
jgi:hypothetical protein